MKDKGEIIVVSYLDEAIAGEAILANGLQPGVVEGDDNNLHGVIAVAAKTARVRDAVGLVIPITGIITRTMGSPLDSTLATLHAQLGTALPPGEMVTAGLKLGDTGTLYVSGFGKPCILSNLYVVEMAREGYRVALNHASHVDDGRALTVRTTVPPILERHDDVISILRCLRTDRTPDPRLIT